MIILSKKNSRKFFKKAALVFFILTFAFQPLLVVLAEEAPTASESAPTPAAAALESLSLPETASQNAQTVIDSLVNGQNPAEAVSNGQAEDPGVPAVPVPDQAPAVPSETPAVTDGGNSSPDDPGVSSNGDNGKKDSQVPPSSEEASVMAAIESVSGTGNTSLTISALESSSPKNLPGIDQNTGALNYNFPIAVPPGRSGLQPDLELAYNSNAQENDSILGYGWSINIPYIQRLNRLGFDKMYDGAPQEQSFYSSLDGELTSALDNSNLYYARTENGDFRKYLLMDDYWIMYDKNGTQYIFGQDDESKQNDPLNTGHTYKWMLKEVRDTNDNFISFSYFKDAGQIYPAFVEYTGNGSTDGAFQIFFETAARTDRVVSYAPGFAVTTNYLVSEISTRLNGALVTKYALSYGMNASNTRSLLESVITSATAADGTVTTLPAQTFTYQSAASSWAQTQSLSKTGCKPGTGFSCATGDHQLFLDLNGDGKQEFVDFSLLYFGLATYTSDSCDAQYGTGQGYDITGNVFKYDGSAWALEPYYDFRSDEFFKNSHVCLNSDATINFADLDGDGLPDLIKSYVDFKSTPEVLKSEVFLNTGSQFTTDPVTSWTLPTATKSGYSVSKIYFSDVNGDNLPDLLESLVCTGYRTGTKCDVTGTLVYLNSGSGWITPGSVWGFSSTPGQAMFQFADIDGDGIQELVAVARGTTSVKVNTYTNLNKSWNLDPAHSFSYSTISTPHNGNVLPNMTFADWNNDGRPDIIKYFINSYSDTNFFSVYKNDVSGFTSASLSLPVSNSLCGTTSSSLCALQFADLNGDGIQDYVQTDSELASDSYTTSSLNFAAAGARQDLLDSITYPQGGGVTIDYKTAAQFSGNKSPYPLFVVSKIASNDGFGNLSSDSYSYTGGSYYFVSASDRGYAGFNQIARTDAAGNVAKTYYHTANGSDSANGEYQDGRYKIGKIYRVENYDNSGNLYRVNVNRWEESQQNANSYFVKLARATEMDYDGQSTHRDKAQTFTYNNTNGNLIQTVDWGQVSAGQDGSFTDSSEDKSTTDIIFATSVGYSVNNAPSSITVTDQYSNKIEESRFYYDNYSFGSVGKGNLTQKEDWISGSNYASAQKTYNSYGLVTQSTDANGNTTSFIYDANNLYPQTVTNAKGQSAQYVYNYAIGSPTQTTDANGMVFKTKYDGFGRVLQQTQPDQANSSTQVTKTAFVYNDASLAGSVQKTDYLDASTNIVGYTYYDGLGRTVQTKRSARNGNFVTNDFAYDNRGNLQKETLPYFSSSASKTSPASGTSLYVSYAYDALGRKKSASNAVGTTAYAYSQWQTTVTDANGNVKDYGYDAHGNLEKVKEHNGADIYTTNYDYDASGNLILISDPDGNVRGFTYDGLGRRLTAQDLHWLMGSSYGNRSYAYDNAGNLTSATDAKNQTLFYSYDSLNRRTSEDAGGAITSYIYDDCVNGIGRLCRIENPTVTETYEYSPLGVKTLENKTRGNETISTQYSYDRQGNILAVTSPDGSQTMFGYNVGGTLENVSRKESVDAAATGVVGNFDYSPAGQIKTINYSNGIQTQKTYDAGQLYRLTQKTTTNGGAYLQNLAYSYDNVGNITQVADSSATQTKKNVAYGYDGLYRLTTVSATGTANGQDYTQSFTYDKLGNILEQKINDTTLAYSYDGINNSNNPSGNPDAVTGITKTVIVNAPVIDSFTATPATISAGQSATLSWALSGDAPTSLSIDNGIGSVMGKASVTVSPVQTTVYTITASNAAGSVSKSVTVTLTCTPKTCSGLGYNCGSVSDGCGGTLSCGTCGSGYVCLSNKCTSTSGTNVSSFVSQSVPTSMYAGVSYPVSVTMKNTGTAIWTAAGTYKLGSQNPANTTRWGVSSVALGSSDVITNGQSKKFDFTVKAPTTAGTYNFQWKMIKGTTWFGSLSTNVAVSVKSTSGTNGASFVSQSVPTTMTAGQTYTVSVTMKNTGTAVWTSAGGFKLGSQNPANTTRWGTSSIALAATDAIASGQSKTFTFTVKAPTTAGTYNFQWKMIKGTTWFGSLSTNVAVKVNAAAAINDGIAARFAVAAGNALSSVISVIAETFSIPTVYAETNSAYKNDRSGKYATGSDSTVLKKTPELKNKKVKEGQLSGELNALVDGTPVSTTVDYQYDANGNLLSDGTNGYDYDYHGWLVRAVGPEASVTGGTSQTISYYEYDSRGQRFLTVVETAVTENSTGNTTYTGVWTYAPWTNYSFTFVNTVVYDSNGNRLSFTSSETEFTKPVFANGQMLATVKGTGTAAKAYTDLTDHLNGTTVVLDSGKNIVETIDYYPYGKLRFDNQVNNYSEKRKYIGQEYDADTQLSYLNARYYNGTTGKFISEDPVFWGSQNLSDPQSLNAYSYANNNPITLSDPEGKNPIIATILLSAIALGHAALLYGAQTNNPKIAELGAGIIATATSLGGVATANPGAISSAKNTSSKNSGGSKSSSATTKSSSASSNKAISGKSTGSSPSANLGNVKISSFGQTIYNGPRDLRSAINNIKNGNLKDRGIFENNENLLPQQKSGYYKEYEVPNTPNYQRTGAGPERIITGQNGEIYYTPDHYETFIKLSE